MADKGVDYAGSSPGAAAIKAAGFQFVARYLSRYAGKTIKPAEYNDMTDNNVGVVLVFEDSATQALAGYAQGVADAEFAITEANSLGWPANRPLYFAVDFDISDAQKPVVAEYFRGVASVIGIDRTGGYGGYWFIKYMFDNFKITWGWQAVAWSGGNVDARAHLFQQLGGTTIGSTACDIDNALQTDYGQNNAKEQIMFNEGDRVNINVYLYGSDLGRFKDAVGKDWKTAMYYSIFETPEFKTDQLVNGGDVPAINDAFTRTDGNTTVGKSWKDFFYNYTVKNAPKQAFIPVGELFVAAPKKAA